MCDFLGPLKYCPGEPPELPWGYPPQLRSIQALQPNVHTTPQVTATTSTSPHLLLLQVPPVSRTASLRSFLPQGPQALLPVPRHAGFQEDIPFLVRQPSHCQQQPSDGPDPTDPEVGRGSFYSISEGFPAWSYTPDA